MKFKIPVRLLMVGDVLQPTGRVVTHAPSKGLFTPKGKVDLGLDGKAAQFGGNTLVSITR